MRGRFGVNALNAANDPLPGDDPGGVIWAGGRPGVNHTKKEEVK